MFGPSSGAPAPVFGFSLFDPPFPFHGSTLAYPHFFPANPFSFCFVLNSYHALSTPHLGSKVLLFRLMSVLLCIRSRFFCTSHPALPSSTASHPSHSLHSFAFHPVNFLDFSLVFFFALLLFWPVALQSSQFSCFVFVKEQMFSLRLPLARVCALGRRFEPPCEAYSVEFAPAHDNGQIQRNEVSKAVL